MNRLSRTSKRVSLSGFDPWLLAGVLALLLVGIVMVYDSSVAIAIRDFGNQYYFVREQLKWMVGGLILMGICSRIDYHRWYAFSLPLLGITLTLLALVFVPGIGVKALGAARWVNLGFTVLQPAELAKLTLVIYLSGWLSTPEKGKFSAFLLLVSMVVGLVVIEPDLGTSIVLTLIALLLYFYSGAALRHFLLLIPLVGAGVLALIMVAPYRLRRFMTFLNPEEDPLGASYHIRQALLAIGSGGLLGLGIGKSRQKYAYLPEANTDSIFAILAEEAGFVGCFLVIMIFVFVIWRGFRIANRAPDDFGRLLALGISSWIAVQSAINISAIIGLAPLTGVPLPFVSYGGSSLIILLSAVGIVINISRHMRKKV